MTGKHRYCHRIDAALAVDGTGVAAVAAAARPPQSYRRAQPGPTTASVSDGTVARRRGYYCYSSYYCYCPTGAEAAAAALDRIEGDTERIEGDTVVGAVAAAVAYLNEPNAREIQVDIPV